jgi:CheY-like chemotaxis protein
MDMLSALRILIVEDSHNSAGWMGLMLKCWGYQSAVVPIGEQALGVAPTFLPDVVILDIGRAGRYGCEAASQLRQLPGMQNTYLVAMTGHDGAVEVQRCQEAGIDHHLVKPVDLAELKKLLESVENRGS